MPRVLDSVFAVAIMALASAAALAQPTAFTYQGRLSQADQPYNGTADFRFRLFDAGRFGSQVGATVDVAAVTVVTS